MERFRDNHRLPIGAKEAVDRLEEAGCPRSRIQPLLRCLRQAVCSARDQRPLRRRRLESGYKALVEDAVTELARAADALASLSREDFVALVMPSLRVDADLSRVVSERVRVLRFPDEERPGENRIRAVLTYLVHRYTKNWHDDLISRCLEWALDRRVTRKAQRMWRLEHQALIRWAEEADWLEARRGLLQAQRLALQEPETTSRPKLSVHEPLRK